MNKNNNSRKIRKNITREIHKIQPRDEYFPNGVFKFHITKLNEHIKQFYDEFVVVDIDVSSYHKFYCNQELNQDYIKAAELKRPVILAEIAPDRLHHGYPLISKDYYSRGYNLIDGHHRLTKAKLEGKDYIKAYIVPMEKHIEFMCEGFEEYVDYWNSKLE